MYLPDKLADLTQKTPVDPFSLDALIAWLRTKPGEETYYYTSNGDCLIAQYLKERCGYKEPNVSGAKFSDMDKPQNRAALPRHWNAIAVGEPRTFADALSRALAYREGRDNG